MVLILVIIILSTCTRNDEPTPSPSPAALPTTLPETVQATIMATGADPSSSVSFSEIVPGIPGRNNREFIELFNPGFEAIDLDGWSLWHQTREGQEPSRLFVWNERADIPGYGALLAYPCR